MEEINIKNRFLTKPLIISYIAFIMGHIFLSILNFTLIWHLVYLIAFLGLFAKTTSHKNSTFIFRVIVPVVIGLGAVVLYRYIYTLPDIVEFLSVSKSNRFHLERLFEVLSTLYAICTAFLLWKGLSDHDSLKQILKDESGQIQSILGFLNYIDGKEKQKTANQIRQNFKIYISRIVHGNKIKSHNDNYSLLSEIRELVIKLNDNNDKDKIAVIEIIKRLNEFFRIRSNRISNMQNKLSPYILMALVFMALSILYVVFTEAPTQFVVVDTIIFILSTLLSFMTMMLIDISQPFDGYWSIKTDTFLEVEKIIDYEIEKHSKD